MGKHEMTYRLRTVDNLLKRYRSKKGHRVMSLYGQWGETNVFGREVLRGEPHCPIKFIFAKFSNQDIFNKMFNLLYLNELKSW